MNTSTSTGTATPANAALREVITVWPVCGGNHGPRWAAESALSKTTSHRESARNRSTAVAVAAASGVPGSTHPARTASALICSPISSGCSASIHHTSS
ncbi:hypothetical protein Prum_096910 [Phytohabitans rumicis]|uniref:Uncharacterized protein n=1 Tax=Phytohabitans rumicis TaxID=1076125 RepID=A0A6V8LN38_9ACTN|nr:hypothetical protein [Phytohabitans rumicis]GFJ96049.1 hypothetical protein Prum_096910 [Phytohabitans rumicis]